MKPLPPSDRAPWVIPRPPVQHPEVSVIISGHPPYRDYAREAIASVYAQDPAISVELLYRESAAWWGDKVNELAAIAKGKWLVILPADDVFAPTFLGACLDARGAADIVYTDVTIFGARESEWKLPEFGLATFKFCACPWTAALTRTALWRDLGGYDPDQDFQDTELWIRAAKAGATAAHIREGLFHSREHPSQGNKLMNQTNGTLRLQAKHPDVYPSTYIEPIPPTPAELEQRELKRRWEREFRAKYARAS